MYLPPLDSDCISSQLLIKERNYNTVIGRPRIRSGQISGLDVNSLQQALLHLLLARDAVLGPRHGFQPLLLHLLLAVRADAILVFLDALQSGINQVQLRTVGIGHTEE